MFKGFFNKFFLSIVLPAILVILLFVISMTKIIIPTFEKGILDKKKEMIKELTNTAWSVLDDYHDKYINGNLSLEEAQKKSSDEIKKMRYGEGRKDYFWIINLEPKMIMHPYRLELNQTNLSNYKDAHGKKLFVEAVNLVNKDKEGYIYYMWQWKDDSTQIVPKLSYVKYFEEWTWIIGTGVYLEDVKDEVKVIKKKLLFISLLITVFIGIVLYYIVKTSFQVEQKRREIENNLVLSRQKYKMLVEASKEGTLLIINDQIAFANLKFNALFGGNPKEFEKIGFDDLFEVDWKTLLSRFDTPQKSLSLETKLIRRDKSLREVVLSVSKINYSGNEGFIVIVKDVSRSKQIEIEKAALTHEMQTALLLMNQPIYTLVESIAYCGLHNTAAEIAEIMDKKDKQVVFIAQEGQLYGFITAKDLVKRVLSPDKSSSITAVEIMNAPVNYINDEALLYEAVLQFRRNNFSNLVVQDEKKSNIGVLSYENVLKAQQNSVSYLIKEIQATNQINQLEEIYRKVPVLVHALVVSGDKTQNITKIITSIADEILHKVISIRIEEVGTPPCKFSFISFGSEGRMEQTLITDQDNAIIIEDVDESRNEVCYDYFISLAKKINEDLNRIGYKLCNGEMMAMNPKWTQPLEVWKSYFKKWIGDSNPKDILEANTFFDYRCVYGDIALSNTLKDYKYDILKDKAVFFHHLANATIRFKPPLNMFGQIVGEGGDEKASIIDIKKVLLPFVGFIRLYALDNGIRKTNSLDRLQSLLENEVISQQLYRSIFDSYNFLMFLRFKFQTEKFMQNIAADNEININDLSIIEVSTLKKVLSQIGELQVKVKFDYKATF